MPIYDYRCEANGRTLEVIHAMSHTVKTWGELCERTGTHPGDAPADAPVERVVALVSAHTKNAPQTGACGSSCACFPE
jgi:hypothetical protein